MNIDRELLSQYGAENKQYLKDELIFREDDYALYYFQIITGKVKLNNYNDEGREFIHNILGENQSFGDSVVFFDRKYSMNAIALTPSEILQLPKHNFMDLLKDHPEVSLEMNRCLAQKLYFKSIMMQHLTSLNPTLKIKGILDYLKSYHQNEEQFSYPVEITRQQLANLTGLRVETVIRTLKKMQKENMLRIDNKKIMY